MKYDKDRLDQLYLKVVIGVLGGAALVAACRVAYFLLNRGL